MSTTLDVAARVAVISHDASYNEGPTAAAADYIKFVNDALEDWNDGGGILPLAEATATQVAATYEYEVPAGFSYVFEVRLEDSTVAGLYDNVVPASLWSLSYMTGSVAKVRLDSRWFTPAAGKKVLIVGQKKQVPLASGDTVLAGMIAFLRERGVYHACRYLMAGGSSLATRRREAAELALKLSADMLQDIPVEFRVIPGSRPVPGR